MRHFRFSLTEDRPTSVTFHLSMSPADFDKRFWLKIHLKASELLRSENRSASIRRSRDNTGYQSVTFSILQRSIADVTKTGCHASMTMTWRPICICSLRYALTDGLVVAARCPTSHRFAMSSTHLLSDLGRLAALSSTTDCQGHSWRLRLEELLTEGCNPVSERRSSSETYYIWP